MSAVEFFKQANKRNKPFRSFGKLELGVYPVLSIKRVTNAKFGNGLRVETKEFLITSPERFTIDLPDEIIERINTGQECIKMIYKGKDVTRNNRIDVDFE